MHKCDMTLSYVWPPSHILRTSFNSILYGPIDNSLLPTPSYPPLSPSSRHTMRLGSHLVDSAYCSLVSRSSPAAPITLSSLFSSPTSPAAYTFSSSSSLCWSSFSFPPPSHLLSSLPALLASLHSLLLHLRHATHFHCAMSFPRRHGLSLRVFALRRPLTPRTFPPATGESIWGPGVVFMKILFVPSWWMTCNKKYVCVWLRFQWFCVEKLWLISFRVQARRAWGRPVDAMRFLVVSGERSLVISASLAEIFLAVIHENCGSVVVWQYLHTWLLASWWDVTAFAHWLPVAQHLQNPDLRLHAITVWTAGNGDRLGFMQKFSRVSTRVYRLWEILTYWIYKWLLRKKYVGRGAGAPRLVHMCDMTHWQVWRDLSIRLRPGAY